MEWNGCVSGLAAVALVMLFILTASGAFQRGAWRETGKWMRRRPWWIWWPLTALVWWPVCFVDSVLWLLFTDRPRPIEQRKSVGAGMIVTDERSLTPREKWSRDNVMHVGDLHIGYVDEPPANGSGRMVNVDGRICWQVTGRDYSLRGGQSITVWDDQWPVEVCDV